MKEKIINKSVNSICKYNKYSDLEVEKIKYGLEGLYLTIYKLIIIILLSIILGFFKETLLVLLFLNIIRYPAFGVHANKSLVCLISSILLILGVPYLIFNIKINFVIKIVISIYCFLNYLLFAPADTVKRPLTNKKKRVIRKVFSCIFSIVYIILIFLLNNNLYSNAILSALIIETVLINPITYIILHTPYNNYKKVS